MQADNKLARHSAAVVRNGVTGIVSVAVWLIATGGIFTAVAAAIAMSVIRVERAGMRRMAIVRSRRSGMDARDEQGHQGKKGGQRAHARPSNEEPPSWPVRLLCGHGLHRLRNSKAERCSRNSRLI